jgi:adenine-specific DNA-methyltransferase
LADTQALRKARGAFFTPPELSRYIVDWAVRARHDLVLEPSCGDAEFLLAAAERLRLLGPAEPASAGGGLHGVELHPESAAAAAERLRAAGAAAEIEVGDFFDVEPSARFDAVVGNPPYVRYQNFTGSARRKGLEAALGAGVRLSGLASTWAAFTVHASRFLGPEGRLGLVLPAELLSVNYAAPVRDFLLRRFARVRLVVFHERVFPGVLEEVVLLLAEGNGGAAGFEMVHVRDAAGLAAFGPPAEQDDPRETWSPAKRSGKWSPALVDTALLADYEAAAANGSFLPLAHWGEVYLGGVTGANAYFTLTRADADALGIPAAELLPISPPGSRHLRGISFTQANWAEGLASGARGLLFRPQADEPSPEALRYISAGEQMGVHTAYKCRVRRPWWRVPLVRAPDLFLTYMNHRHPRLVAN